MIDVKKNALTVLFVIVLAGLAYTTGNLLAIYLTPAPVKPQVDNRYGSIVRLVRNDHTFCSGTVVNQNLIITAAHCVLQETPFGLMLASSTVEIRPGDNENVGTIARVNYASPQMDQAVLVGDFRIYKTRKFISDPETLTFIKNHKTHFTSCGFPLNGDLYCSETTMSGPEDFFWAVNGVLIPGMSGGPTFLPDGTMVGVNVAVSKDKSIISPIYNITKNIVRSK